MEAISVFADKYGWLVAIFLFLVVTQKDHIGMVMEKWFGVSITAKESEGKFEDELRQRALQNGEYSRSLVDRLFIRAEAETVERRAANAMLFEQTKTTEVLASKSVEVMQDFANIARINAGHWEEVSGTLSRLNSTMEGIAFLLAQITIEERQGLDYQSTLEALKKGNAQDECVRTD